VPEDTRAGGQDTTGPGADPGALNRLGHYRIFKRLGQGGRGAVMLAEDERLHRPVALKVMLPGLAADPAAKERFLREARSAAAVKHDHVVTIYQVDEANGIPFIAMEFLQGGGRHAGIHVPGASPG